MAFLWIALLLVTISTAQQVDREAPNIQTQPSPIKVLRVPEYIEKSQVPQLSYNLQLPREESSNVPFYNTELSLDLKPPSDYYEPNYFEGPVPARDLLPPPTGVWNPNNDPAFYYDNAPKNQEVPTVIHPKKFNKSIHDKTKYVDLAKKIALEDDPTAQKMIEKFEKLRNQKELQSQKVSRNEPIGADSTLAARVNDDLFGEGLSSAITDSLGISVAPGERLDFHMQGHKGPDSYKWGFDTGKGRNRQFRFEEKDENGHVKGQYGYYDKMGKLNVFHYDASSDGGFNAKSNSDTK